MQINFHSAIILISLLKGEKIFTSHKIYFVLDQITFLEGLDQNLLSDFLQNKLKSLGIKINQIQASFKAQDKVKFPDISNLIRLKWPKTIRNINEFRHDSPFLFLPKYPNNILHFLLYLLSSISFTTNPLSLNSLTF